MEIILGVFAAVLLVSAYILLSSGNQSGSKVGQEGRDASSGENVVASKEPPFVPLSERLPAAPTIDFQDKQDYDIGPALPPVEVLFSFKGRIRRAYWWGYNFFIMVFIMAWNGMWSTFDSDLGLIMSFVGFIIAMWMSLAVSVKRWHVLGKSGFWELIMFIPLIGPVWSLIEKGFLPGSEAPNRFEKS